LNARAQHWRNMNWGRFRGSIRSAARRDSGPVKAKFVTLSTKEGFEVFGADPDGIGDADVTEFSAVAEGVDGGSADAEPAGGFDLKELAPWGASTRPSSGASSARWP